MNQKIFLPVLGLFLVTAVLIGFWLSQPQVFAEDAIPEPPNHPIALELDYMEVPTVEDGQDVPEPSSFTQPGSDYMRKYLLEPSEKLNDFVDEDMMSRCGSGAYYNLTASPTDDIPYYLGTVSLSWGCGTGDDFFDFRVSPDGLILEILDGATGEYVPYNKWFEAAKPLV